MTFHCVILASVYDVKNLKRKLRPGEEHQRNSPWNIAVDLTLDMSFSGNDIAGMLREELFKAKKYVERMCIRAWI